MQPAIRTQVETDKDRERWGQYAALDFSEEIDLARQEFREDADINTILRKFGLNSLTRPPAYGIADFTIDLQTAMHAISDAEQAHRRLPEHIRSRYRTWREFLNAVAAGQIKQEDLKPPKPEPEPEKPAETKVP